MNSKKNPANFEATPRLACRIVRQWSALSGNSRPSHAHSCASCVSYFAAVHDLEAALQRDAAAANVSQSTRDFEREIIRAVRLAASEPTRKERSLSIRYWTFGGLATAAALAAVVLSLNLRPRLDQGGITQSSTEGAAVIVSAVQSLSTGLVDSVIPSAGELVAKNPLQNELGSVYSDVRSALDFLALNFLPTPAAVPAPQPSRQI